MKKHPRFVVHCSFGYYGPDPDDASRNVGDLPLEAANRYAHHEAKDMAAHLGGRVEEVDD